MDTMTHDELMKRAAGRVFAARHDAEVAQGKYERALLELKSLEALIDSIPAQEPARD